MVGQELWKDTTDSVSTKKIHGTLTSRTFIHFFGRQTVVTRYPSLLGADFYIYTNWTPQNHTTFEDNIQIVWSLLESLEISKNVQLFLKFSNTCKLKLFYRDAMLYCRSIPFSLAKQADTQRS